MFMRTSTVAKRIKETMQPLVEENRLLRGLLAANGIQVPSDVHSQRLIKFGDQCILPLQQLKGRCILVKDVDEDGGPIREVLVEAVSGRYLKIKGTWTHYELFNFVRLL